MTRIVTRVSARSSNGRALDSHSRGSGINAHRVHFFVSNESMSSLRENKMVSGVCEAHEGTLAWMSLSIITHVFSQSSALS